MHGKAIASFSPSAPWPLRSTEGADGGGAGGGHSGNRDGGGAEGGNGGGGGEGGDSGRFGPNPHPKVRMYPPRQPVTFICADLGQMSVGGADLAAFERDGYLVVKGFAQTSECLAMREAMAHLIEQWEPSSSSK